MPSIDFTPEFKRDSSFEVDKLKLKLGETGRIVMLERPTFAWTHTLRSPKIVNGEAAMAMRKRRGSDEEVMDYDLQFIGRPQCLGDYGIIADKGSDPRNCPVCKAAADGAEVGSPERRFAVNVIKYATNRDGALVTPFSCSALVWIFTEGYFNKMYSLAQEHGSLVGRDLVLGPCEAPESYQKFAIVVGAKDVWKVDERVKTLVVDTFKNQRVEDLERACGRVTEAQWMRKDIDEITAKWRIARRTVETRDGTEATAMPSLTDGLADLLGSTPTPPAPAVDLGAMLETPTSAPAATGPVVAADTSGLDFSDLINAAPATPAAPTPAPAEDAMDFEKLLSQISAPQSNQV